MSTNTESKATNVFNSVGGHTVEIGELLEYMAIMLVWTIAHIDRSATDSSRYGM